MSDYQDLILENQMVLEELEQECQDKINENMAFPMDQIICGNREYQPEQGSMYYRLKAYAKYLQMCVTVRERLESRTALYPADCRDAH
ncbi:MAG: hypothetical protein PUK71_10025 [Blautia obeum]|nr:hypothetical protein [Blautia obeum]